MNFLLLLLALPLCLAQFSIQGPSDGNRVAQGLKVSDDRGIEYTDQSESQGSGDFTIQGATDGNSNFRIQGATDGHSNFQIQGPSDGGAEKYNFQGAGAGAGADRYNYQETGPGQVQNFNIQGATDGHSQSIIQGPYDANQGAGKSLSYNDPSGLRVNWKSYERQPRPRQQAQPQYYSDNAAPANVPQRAQPRQRAYAQPRAHAAQAPVAQAPAPAPVYKPYDNAPQQIKELLQFQAQIPYLNSIPPAFRYEQLAAAQAQGQQSQYQNEAPEPAPAPQRPTYRSKQRPQQRQKRQAQEQKNRQPQYRRLEQPPADPQIQYSPNLPSKIQELLKFQSQIPYVSVIPEQYRYDVESAAQNQAQQVRAHYENLGRQPPPSGGRGHSRQRRQAQHQQQDAGQQQYRRISQPPAEPQPQYSNNLPSHLQQLLKYQAATPHNIIANQIVYRPDKPYVPQPIQPSAPQQAQYQGQGGAYQGQGGGYQDQGGAYQDQGGAYQGQGGGYQGQGAAYQAQGDAYQAQGSAYQGQASSSYPQSQLIRQPNYPQGYGQGQGGIRPVTENQY